jgi:uncharacterized protein (DUF4415 family)
VTERKSYIDENGDAVELDESWFREAKRGRPPLAPETRKRRATISLDPEVVEGFKAGGPGWQTRMNEALRKALGLEPRLEPKVGAKKKKA